MGFSIKKESKTYERILLIIFLTIFIGTRHQVGPDWDIYLNYPDRTANFSFWGNLFQKEGIFRIINWFFNGYETPIYFVNTICALIFSYCIIQFCKSLPNFWLAFNLNLPYIIFVVGMGLTRQAVALSLVMYGLIYLTKQKYSNFLISLLIAVGFHVSSIINIFFLFPLIRSKYIINRFIYFSFILVITIVFIQQFASFTISNYYQVYIQSIYYESEGAYIRILMNLFPAILFFILRNKILVNQNLKIQLYIQSIFIFILFFLLNLFPELSTPIDRIALYFSPLQIILFCYIVKSYFMNISPKLKKILITAYSFSIFMVWFTFANNATHYLPYKSILFM